MTDPTPTPDSVEKADAANKADRLKTDGSLNTGLDQTSFNKGIDVGFAKGANKATKELFEKVGLDDIEAIKVAVSFKKEYEESQKTAAEQLNLFKDENKELKKQLKSFQDQIKLEAETLFQQLSEEQQTSIKAASIPIEKMVPVIKTLLESKPPVKNTIGTPFSPKAPDNTKPSLSKLTRTGVNPEYRQDKDAYIQKKLEDFHRKNKV